MSDLTQERWVEWMQSIEDAAKSLKESPMKAEYWPEVVEIDKSLWEMHQEITLEERGKK